MDLPLIEPLAEEPASRLKAVLPLTGPVPARVRVWIRCVQFADADATRVEG